MTASEKLTQELRSQPRTWKWRKAKRLARQLGCEIMNLSGSSRAMIHPSGRKLVIHEPHPGNELKAYQVRKLKAFFEEEGDL